MSGFRLRCLDQNADRISVQSTEAQTWAPLRRKFKFMPAKFYDVPVGKDELVVIKTRGPNHITLELIDQGLIIRSSRQGAITGRPGEKIDIRMGDGEAVTIRARNAHEPQRPHRTAKESELV